MKPALLLVAAGVLCTLVAIRTKAAMAEHIKPQVEDCVAEQCQQVAT